MSIKPNRLTKKKIIKSSSSKEPIYNTSGEEVVPATIGTPLKNVMHERFCLHYARTLNGTDSYLAARQIDRGTSIKTTTANVEASKLLSTPNIQTRVSELMDHTANSLRINKSRVLEGIQHEINRDPADVFEWNGYTLTLKRLEDIPLHVRQTIRSIKQRGGGKVDVTFYDRQRAREQLMKYMGMLSDQVDVNVNVDLGSALAAAHRRVIRSRGATNSPEEIENAEFEEI